MLPTVEDGRSVCKRRGAVAEGGNPPVLSCLSPRHRLENESGARGGIQDQDLMRRTNGAAMINISLAAAAAVDFFSYRHFGFTFCGTIPPLLLARFHPSPSLPCLHVPSLAQTSNGRGQPSARAATLRSPFLSSLSLSTWLPPPSRARPD